MDLLITLVERPGQLLTKFQLLEAAWGSSCVHESNLKVTIAALRRSLHQHEPAAEYIRTIIGRGYWFDATQAAPRIELSVPASPAPAGALPPVLTAMFGRATALAELGQLLSHQRLTTIVGPGGVGKTVVAIAAARRYEEETGICVAYIDLGAVASEEFVITKIAAALGISSTAGDALDAVTASLARRRALLLIDTCEQVRDVVAHVCNVVLAKTADVRIVATSRQVLGSKGEQVYWLPPLETPPEGLNSAEAILRCASVQLLAARAQEYGAYAIREEDAEAIGAICRSLDSVPLALEFAAARLAFQSADSAYLELQHRLHVLRRHREDGPQRQRTLLLTLEWSYALLSWVEACVLRAMSIFSGAFDTDALAQVLSHTAYGADQIFDALNGLRAKSMLSIDHEASRIRYRLLDSTRMFALELLHSHGEYAAVAARHASG